MVAHTHVPLIINGEDILLPSRECQETIYAPASDRGIVYQGATEELATKAIESGAIAFTSWSKTEPTERRKLFLQAAEVRSSVPFLSIRVNLLVLILFGV